MTSSHPQNTVTVLGTLPPLRGLSSYCREFALAMADVVPIEFMSFRSLYPAALYPGGGLKEDDSFLPAEHPHLTVRRRLKWYNPATWLAEGLGASGDLLHAQWWSLPLAPVYMTVCLCFKLRKKPVVLTVHNVMPHESSRLYKAVSAMLFRLGDHFIVHTEPNRQQLMARYGIATGRISVIAHGPLQFRMDSSLKDKEACRQSLGIAAGEKVLLFWGAIRPYKGIDTALKAVAHVLPEFPDIRLVIAGKLWEPWERYHQLIEQLGIADRLILHLDYVSAGDAARYFTAADLVLLPYHHFDSQSGVGAAAVAFNKPLIVSDTGGLPDFVTDPRWVTPPGNASALAQAIVACLSDERCLKAMAADSAAVAASTSWPNIAKQTNLVYSQIFHIRGENGCFQPEREPDFPVWR